MINTDFIDATTILIGVPLAMLLTGIFVVAVGMAFGWFRLEQHPVSSGLWLAEGVSLDQARADRALFDRIYAETAEAGRGGSE